MDSHDLDLIPDCKNFREHGYGEKTGKPCFWWDDRLCECYKKSDIPCPQGVRQPQPDFVEMDYDEFNYEYDYEHDYE